MTVREFEQSAQEMMESIKALVRRVPEDQLDWRPVETVMTMRELLAHLPDTVSGVVGMAVTQQWPSMEEMQAMFAGGVPSATPAEAIAKIEEEQQKLRQYLNGITDEQWLTDQRRLPWGVSGSLAYCCASGLEHGAGHRYQLFLYLKLLGQPISTMELYNVSETAWG